MIYWLYLRLRMRRFFNLMTRGKVKRRGHAVFTLMAGGLVFWGSFSLSHVTLDVLKNATELAAYLTCAMAVCLFMTIGQREFAAAEWDLEWLITLPVSRLQLIGMRLVERTGFNPISFVILFPILTQIYIHGGQSWPLSALFGYLTCLPLFAVVAVLQTVIDTGLRVRLRSSSLRNLQALFSVSSLIMLYTSIPRAMETPLAIRTAAQLFGDTLWLMPTGAAAAFAHGQDGPWLLLVEALTALVLGTTAVVWLLRDGVVANAGQNSGRRAHAPLREAVSSGRISPMFSKELKLLARDRNYLVQTLLMPILILGMQIYLRTEKEWESSSGVTMLAVSAYGMASYAMLFSAFNILSTEGAALWLWYTFPHRLPSLILQKRRPWMAVAFLYWLLFAIYAYVSHPELDVAFIRSFALALVGVGINVILATALGIFSFDPQSLEVGRRVKISYLYLYMVLASTFGLLFLTTSLWKIAAGVILSALLASAFWQKASRYLPYLLDPSEAPPRRLTWADALLAAYGLFLIGAMVLPWLISRQSHS